MNSFSGKQFLLLLETIQTILKNMDMNRDPKIAFNEIIEICERFMKTFSDDGMKEAASEFKKEMEEMENTELHIAITGESGSGKSSLINALRGLKAEDDCAAPVGVTETTMKPKVYMHPNFPNVKFWDLPGIGSPRFSPKDYLKEVNYSKYDFFIIVGSGRFQNFHTELAKEIQRMGKRFYFVRSKIDIDLYNAKRDFPKTFNEDQVIKKIRDDCNKYLLDFKDHQCFLVSSCDLDKYDFGKLVEKLVKDLPSLKRLAFLLSLPNISLEVIEKKKSELKSHILKISLVSAAVEATTLPGLPLRCNVSVLYLSMVAFYKYFELDDGSLARLARLSGKPVEELKAVIKSPQQKEMTRDLVINQITNHVKELLVFLPSPLGSLVAAGVSFVITYRILSRFLDNLAEDAERVRKKALGLEECEAEHLRVKQD